tara:strand:+ start:231 stop:608 length:378 start_codon:yes stop_codon:yes gene_type:complete
MLKRSNKNNELTKVKIGFADITIERTEPSFKKSNTDCFGQYLARENKIEIQKEVSGIDYANTLLHEIIHAIIYLSSLNADGGALKDDDAEEQVANTTTNWLMGVFRDNPQILDIIKEEVNALQKS